MRIGLLATISCYIQMPKRSKRQKMFHQILLSKFITNLEYQTCQRIFFLFLHPYVINQVLLGSKLENIYHDKNRNFIGHAWVSGHSDFYSALPVLQHPLLISEIPLSAFPNQPILYLLHQFYLF